MGGIILLLFSWLNPPAPPPILEVTCYGGSVTAATRYGGTAAAAIKYGGTVEGCGNG